MEIDSVGIIAILSMSYSKNIDKGVKNLHNARRKPNYHTKCDKNCHKILSMYTGFIIFGMTINEWRHEGKINI